MDFILSGGDSSNTRGSLSTSSEVYLGFEFNSSLSDETQTKSNFYPKINLKNIAICNFPDGQFKWKIPGFLDGIEK